VQAFGVTFPPADAERAAVALAPELLEAVVEARDDGDLQALEALNELLTIYERRMGSLLPKLRAAMEMARSAAIETVLEPRSEDAAALSDSCSPAYVDAILAFAGVDLAEPSFHDSRDLLDEALGMLRLRRRRGAPAARVSGGERASGSRSTASGAGDARASAGDDDDDDDEEDRGSSVDGDGDDDNDDDASSSEGDACDEATWDVLQQLLGFHHEFKPAHAPRILYDSLTPALRARGLDAGFEDAEFCAVFASRHAMRHAPLVTALARHCFVGSDLNFATDVWPLICGEAGVWMGGEDPDSNALISLERCVWKASRRGAEYDEVWQVLQRTGCHVGKVVSLCDKLDDFIGSDEGITADSGCIAVKTCCLKGAAGLPSGVSLRPGASSSTAPPLPYPTCLDMLLSNTLPWLLGRLKNDHDGRLPEQEEAFMDGLMDGPGRVPPAIVACYDAILAAFAAGDFSRGKRWAVMVPSATLSLRMVIVDDRLNRWLATEAAHLVVCPDERRWPLATDLLLRHRPDVCLHPELAERFAAIAHKQNVGLESPRDHVQRSLGECLRVAHREAQRFALALDLHWAELRGLSHPAAQSNVAPDPLEAVWALVAELYERPLDPSLPPPPYAAALQMQSPPSASEPAPATAGAAAATPGSIPHGFSESDNWEVLLFGVIACAKAWCRMQTSGTAEDASRYRSTVQLARRLVPFVELQPDGSRRWTFLSERERAATADGSVWAEEAAEGERLLRRLREFDPTASDEEYYPSVGRDVHPWDLDRLRRDVREEEAEAEAEADAVAEAVEGERLFARLREFDLSVSEDNYSRVIEVTAANPRGRRVWDRVSLRNDIEAEENISVDVVGTPLGEAMSAGLPVASSSASAAPPSPPPPPPGVLLLGTLFGSEMYGNLGGLELHGRPPTLTPPLPERVLAACKAAPAPPSSSSGASSSPPSPGGGRGADYAAMSASTAAPTPSRLEGAVFAGDVTAATLTLVWEWFLLEVAGAAPPAVLWATIQVLLAPTPPSPRSFSPPPHPHP